MKFYIDKIGRTIESYIKESMEARALPDCLGSMIPPLIIKEMDLPLSVLQPKKSVTAVTSEVTNVGVNELLQNSEYEDYILSRAGEAQIELHKKNLAELYAAKVAKCFKCTMKEACKELTRNYLYAVDLNERGN